MNPPVDAPASRHRARSTVKPRGSKASRAPSSLWAPREAQLTSLSSSATRRGVPGSTAVAGLDATVPAIFTRPASISSEACSRDLASPRRTSSASTRARRATSGLVDGGQGPNQHFVGPVQHTRITCQGVRIDGLRV